MSNSHQQQTPHDASSRLPNNTSTSSSSYLSMNSLTGASAAASVTSAMYNSISNNNNSNNSNLDIYLTKLQEDQQHDRLAKNQKSKLLQKNLESLRGLVSEIQADDWKYNNNDHDETVSDYFTRMDGWGTDQMKRGGGN